LTESNESGIYKIKNLVNEKVYIGSAKCFKNRKREHLKLLRHNKHYNFHLQSSWNKYGESNFEFQIVQTVDDLNLLAKTETYWIRFFDSANKNKGYNLVPTGFNMLGYKHTEESKSKMRMRRVGVKLERKRKEKIGKSVSSFRKNATKEWKDLYSKKLSDSKLGERHHLNKLKENDVYVIKLLLRDTKLRQHEIASCFGVHRYTVSDIKNNKTWGHILISEEDKLNESWILFASKTVKKRIESGVGAGTKSSRAKLNEDQVRDIKKRMKHTDIKNAELAREYNVSKECISSIRKNRSWKHVRV
jgi:group I intron endonuclease